MTTDTISAETIRVLNLYAGIGGNRKLWTNCDVTAVEMNADIAAVYQDMFPDDKVIVGDAHQYLLDHYKEYDFIWLSHPCQSHSRIRQFVGVKAKGFPAIYPELSLYQEIIFLQHNAVCDWSAENVNPYYKPLIEPTAHIGRHLFWSNLPLESYKTKAQHLRSRNAISDVEDLHAISLDKYKIPHKRQILRNYVEPEIGKAIFDVMLKNRIKETTNGS